MATSNMSSEEKNVEQTGKLKNKKCLDFGGISSGAYVVKLCYGLDIQELFRPHCYSPNGGENICFERIVAIIHLYKITVSSVLMNYV